MYISDVPEWWLYQRGPDHSEGQLALGLFKDFIPFIHLIGMRINIGFDKHKTGHVDQHSPGDTSSRANSADSASLRDVRWVWV